MENCIFCAVSEIACFQLLYKSNKAYKEIDPEVNAWNEISNSLDYITDGMYYILATI